MSGRPGGVAVRFLLLFLATLAALAAAALLGYADALVEPLRAQVEHRPGAGYTVATLAAWAAVGALGVAAYMEQAERAPLLKPGPRTLAALAPLLAFGPVFHALLVARALPPWLSWPAAEPLVYATVAALALALGAAGALVLPANRARGRDVALATGGVAALLGALLAFSPRAGAGAGSVLAIVGGAAALALAVWLLVRRVRHEMVAAVGTLPGLLVLAGHALDGVTTWVGVRDPFGWGLGGFSEKNPLSDAFLSIGNGWPFLLVKLALPLLALSLFRDLKDPFHRDLAYLALFVLGFGPGASNAAQMALR